jgi:hypothetical protein
MATAKSIYRKAAVSRLSQHIGRARLILDLLMTQRPPEVSNPEADKFKLALGGIADELDLATAILREFK